VTRAWLIAGAGGMLGTALQRVLTERGERFVAPPERELDVTDTASVARAAFAFTGSLTADEEPVLVNAAAFTDVEAAEDAEEAAFAVNEGGARKLAVIAREAGLRFVHISTDFVFDGRKQGAYTEDDPPDPLSVYGASKLAGERAVAWENPEALTVRTAWVFGAGGANFPVKVLAAARERGAISVVTDEVGSPTYTCDLADGIARLVAANAAGLVHLAGSGSCTRHELAVEVLRRAGLGHIPVAPVLSAEFPTKAARPKNSVLDCSLASSLGVTLPHWTDAVARFLAEVGVT
jgi:dTDP-4-dehydrorhamnose reductase